MKCKKRDCPRYFDGECLKYERPSQCGSRLGLSLGWVVPVLLFAVVMAIRPAEDPRCIKCHKPALPGNPLQWRGSYFVHIRDCP